MASSQMFRSTTSRPGAAVVSWTRIQATIWVCVWAALIVQVPVPSAAAASGSSAPEQAAEIQAAEPQSRVAQPPESQPSESRFKPLYSIPVSVEGEVGPGAPWVKLLLKSPDDVSLRSDSANVDDNGFLVIDLGAAREASDEPAEGHRAATFLVDFDEPPIEELLAAAERPKDDEQAIDALLTLTDRAIPNKSLLRDWDAASVVVRRGEGDCTEHAVLLAALARGWGLPARVVVGSLLAVLGDRVDAYGHAWTEVFVDGVWRRADAAQIVDTETVEASAEPPPRLYYIPLSVVESEGPGYSLPLISLSLRTHPQSIVVGWSDLGGAP